MREDQLFFNETIAYLETCPCSSDFFNLTGHPASPKRSASSTAPHQHPNTADMFASRKRDREDGEDDLQQCAPDAKVSAIDYSHRDRLADQRNRNQLYPSVPHQLPDTSALFHNHEADLHLSSHKPSRPQILQKKRTPPLFNLQAKPTNSIIQPYATAPLSKETRALMQTWT